MTRHRTAIRTLAISTILVAMPLGSALAQDVNGVAERMKALLAKQGVELAWTGISGDASKMVMAGVTVGPAKEAKKLELGDVTLTDITEENGGYTVGSMTFPDYSRTQDGATVEASGIEVGGMKLPAEGSDDPLAGLMMYSNADIDTISVKIADKQAFSMDNLHFEATPPADGELDIAQYDITVDNAGTFGMSFDIGGYTKEFIKSLQELQKKMAEQPEGADNSAQGMAMLGLMQQLTFISASIRFDDDSLTNKALEYAAGQQGAKPDDLKNQAKAILPFLLAQLNNPDFTTQATQAVSAYLDDPQSIEIDAEPENPVPFALIMAGAMSTPQELIKTLAVSVTANEED